MASRKKSLRQLLETLPRKMTTNDGWCEGEYHLTLTADGEQYVGFGSERRHWPWKATYSTHDVDRCKDLWDKTGDHIIAGYGSTPEIALRKLAARLRRFKFID